MTETPNLEWLERTVGVRPLPERAVIELRGDDARDWLQGQVTNQLEGADPQDAVYAFVLTLKGRVLADVYVLRRDDDAWLDVPASRVEALLERLDRYIIMEDVELEARPDLRVVVAEGPLADRLAGGWRSSRLGAAGRQWVVPESDLQAELADIEAQSRALGGNAIDDDAWDAAHAARGRPRFDVDFGDATYPQETGLAPLAVSFNKGCYIGQETVVMLENRGKAPKTLWRWELDGAEPPPAGTPIDRAGAVVGQLTSAAVVGGRLYALGFLKRGKDDELDGLRAEGREARPLGPAEQGPGVTGDAT